MNMHEFWASFPAWEIIILAIYSVILVIYFFTSMIVSVDENSTPFFIISRIGYDYLKTPFWVSLFVLEIFMLPAQLMLLTVYALVQITWNIKERPKKNSKKQ